MSTKLNISSNILLLKSSSMLSKSILPKQLYSSKDSTESIIVG